MKCPFLLWSGPTLERSASSHARAVSFIELKRTNARMICSIVEGCTHNRWSAVKGRLRIQGRVAVSNLAGF